MQNADRIDLATAADQVARVVLHTDAQLRTMSAADLAGAASHWEEQVAVDDPAATPDAALNLALVLAREGGSANLERAGALLAPIARSNAPALQPWQPMASMLADRIDAERHLQKQVDRQMTQTAQDQHQIGRLTQKLNALKAIELSMSPSATSILKNHRHPGPPMPGSGVGGVTTGTIGIPRPATNATASGSIGGTATGSVRPTTGGKRKYPDTAGSEAGSTAGGGGNGTNNATKNGTNNATKNGAKNGAGNASGNSHANPHATQHDNPHDAPHDNPEPGATAAGSASSGTRTATHPAATE